MLHKAAVELQRDVELLLQKHSNEVQAFIHNWLQNQTNLDIDSDEAASPTSPKVNEFAQAPGTPIEPWTMEVTPASLGPRSSKGPHHLIPPFGVQVDADSQPRASSKASTESAHTLALILNGSLTHNPRGDRRNLSDSSVQSKASVHSKVALRDFQNPEISNFDADRMLAKILPAPDCGRPSGGSKASNPQQPPASCNAWGDWPTDDAPLRSITSPDGGYTNGSGCARSPTMASIVSEPVPGRDSRRMNRSGTSSLGGGTTLDKLRTMNSLSTPRSEGGGRVSSKDTLGAALDLESKPKKSKKRTERKVHTFISKNRREEVLSTQTPLQRFISNRFFELITAFVILLNALFMGWQTEFQADRVREMAASGVSLASLEEPIGVAVLQGIFCIIFCMELSLRWAAEGPIDFFRASDWTWNIFDVVVVVFSVLDFLAVVWPLFQQQSSAVSNTSILRVMRVLRIVRVVRVIRIMRFFRELRMMIFGLLGCAKSLFWAFMVLLVIFFICGISITTGTIEYLDKAEMWSDDRNQKLISWFGTLDAAVMNLYMAMSGGRDWAEYLEVLGSLSISYRIIFMAYITFAILAVINIVTGIFVEGAMQLNQADRELVVSEELAVQGKYRDRMRQMFEEIDSDLTGKLTIDEFEQKLDDERVIAYFNTLHLDVSDARKLFTLLDGDRSGEIDAEEFLMGCQKLKGESRALDTAMLQYEVGCLVEMVLELKAHFGLASELDDMMDDGSSVYDSEVPRIME